MKKLLAVAAVLMLTSVARAGHISGGEIYYQYIGPGATANSDQFKITLRLFRECNPDGTNVAPMPDNVILGIFRRNTASTYALYTSVTVNRTAFNTFSATPSAYPCITNFPSVCYQVGYFETTIDLPKETFGYLVSFQTCCRTNGILNMQGFAIPGGNGFFGDGATYVADIPGTTLLGASGTNKSPVFDLKDTAIVCANSRFTLPFSATDADGDSLSYSFCSAFNRGIATDASNIVPSTPPYSFITYLAPFSGGSPLGASVSINPHTGLITGVAPDQGKYVINVCIEEWRGGVRISEHRKDFILRVQNCQMPSAGLSPSYLTCDGFTMTFQNLTNSPLVNSWYWDFGDATTNADTSTLSSPTYTYPDSGQYVLKLVVNRGQQCTDSNTAIVNVYPGFIPNFTATGGCKDFPVQFNDNTTSKYGVVNGWRWNFGDLTTLADSSHLQNPAWKYADTGTKQVQLIVANSKGCVDTVMKSVVVFDKPPITLPFKDTLICSIDTLQLIAQGTGNFTWTPNYNILNPATATPLVYPKTTTYYSVQLDDRGCINHDSIRVRVVDFVTLGAPLDTTICLTDSVVLRPSGDGLRFSWSPPGTLSNPNTEFPVARPTGTTRYYVQASIGKCSKRDSVLIRTVPYPTVAAGPDVTICYDDTTQLIGSIGGTSFRWTPITGLINPNVLNPLAHPLVTTRYVLITTDSLSGCPKPSLDTVVVNVRAKILAFAGNDTAVVVGEPLQLNASGGLLYSWSPPTGLNRTDIRNPIAILNDNQTYILRAYTPEDCEGFDTINIKVFKTKPDIFVPNAFTPLGPNNKIFRPIPVGISNFQFFRIYNRWGQLVYNTTEAGKGWDGTISGKMQDPATFVWIVQGVDFTGKTVFKKGTMILIR